MTSVIENTKRNYIRKKKYFVECKDLIEKTLEYIYKREKKNVSEIDIQNESDQYASEVEAACWNPKLKLSDDDYQAIIHNKARELCLALLSKHIPKNELEAILQRSFETLQNKYKSLQQDTTIQPEPLESPPVLLPSDDYMVSDAYSSNDPFDLDFHCYD